MNMVSMGCASHAVKNSEWIWSVGSYAEVNHIILDEPASSLDALSEHEFHQVLRALNSSDDLTVIFIAHLLKFAIDVDHIIVFRNGVIDAQGSHADLRENSDWYSRAVRIGSQTRANHSGKTNAYPDSMP